MIVSNALPIQFWPAAQDTYNENQVCGVEPRCWCAPWQCDDTIQIQVTAEGEEDLTDFAIAVFDEDGAIVYDVFFPADGYSFFVPNIFEMCDAKYQIVLYDSTSEEIKKMLNPSEWVDAIGSWTKNDMGGYFENGPTGNVQQQIRMPLALSDGITFSFDFTVQISGTWTGNVVMAFIITDGAGLNKDSPMENLIYTANTGSDPQTVTFTVRNGDGFSTDPMAYLQFVLFGPTSSGTATVRISIIPDEVFEIGEGAILYKSDCLDIRTTQECTELITYSNNKDFAGLRYSNITPLPEFTLRVPAVFFHESFPQDEEVHPKSDDTWIRLSSRMERKKLLDIGYIPYYMHQKIQLVLMHDNVEIQGEQWKKRDAYNIEEASKRFPLPKANVLLTDKDFIVRNLI